MSWLRISKSCIVFDSYRVVLCRAAILGAISVHIEREGEATSHKFTLSPSRVQMTGVATAYKLDLALVPGYRLPGYKQLKNMTIIRFIFFKVHSSGHSTMGSNQLNIRAAFLRMPDT